jgi:hypothetical protein
MPLASRSVRQWIDSRDLARRRSCPHRSRLRWTRLTRASRLRRMSKCPVCGERATKGKRGRSLHSAYTVSTLVEELKLVQTKAGQESAQAAARIVP